MNRKWLYTVILCFLMSILSTTSFAADKTMLYHSGEMVNTAVISEPEELNPELSLLDSRTSTVTQNGITYTLADSTALVSGYTPDIAAECIIPSSITVNGTVYTVTSIDTSGLYNCSQITSISLPNTITSIGGSAFKGCTNLKSITIPKSVTSIASNSLQNCTSLTDITVEAGNPRYFSVNGVLFEGNESVPYQLIQYPAANPRTSYTMPEQTNSVSSYAFANATNLTNVTCNDSLTSIERYAFEDCTNLKTIDLGDSLITLEYDAFASCTSLTSLHLPSTLTVAPYAQFFPGYNLDSLTALTVAEGNPTFRAVDGVLFQNIATAQETPTYKLVVYPAASSITNYTFPEQLYVTSIGSGAFWGAEQLTTINLPDTLQSIESIAFTSCGLTSISIPDSVTEIGSYAFQTCFKLSSVTLGSGITTLSDELFSYCRSLSTITIPKQVTTLGSNVFQGCYNLSSIHVESGSTSFSSVDGILYNADQSTLLLIPQKLSISTMTIPVALTEISYGAFSELTTLAAFNVEDENDVYSVDSCGALLEKNDDGTTYTLHTYPVGLTSSTYTVPDSVTKIAPRAFYRHPHITTVSAPNVKTIGEHAFTFSTLKNIDIPMLVSLESEAFSNTKLTTLTFPASFTTFVTDYMGQSLDFCDELEYIIFQNLTAPVHSHQMLCNNSKALRYVYVPAGTQIAYKDALSGKLTPGAMIVEGTYIPQQEVSSKIENLTDTSDLTTVNDVAANVVRLSQDDAAKLTDQELQKVDKIFEEAHANLTITGKTAELENTSIRVDGLALASGLVEQQAEDGTVSGSVALTATEMELNQNEYLKLEFDLTVNNQPTQLQAPVLISVELPENVDKDNLRLVHKDDSGKKSLVDFQLSDNTATFRASSFSSYTFEKKQDPRVSYTVRADQAVLYLAGYNADGKMVSISCFNVTRTNNALYQTFQAQDNLTYRAFVLNSALQIVGTAAIDLNPL